MASRDGFCDKFASNCQWDFFLDRKTLALTKKLEASHVATRSRLVYDLVGIRSDLIRLKDVKCDRKVYEKLARSAQLRLIGLKSRCQAELSTLNDHLIATQLHDQDVRRGGDPIPGPPASKSPATNNEKETGIKVDDFDGDEKPDDVKGPPIKQADKTKIQNLKANSTHRRLLSRICKVGGCWSNHSPDDERIFLREVTKKLAYKKKVTKNWSQKEREDFIERVFDLTSGRIEAKLKVEKRLDIWIEEQEHRQSDRERLRIWRAKKMMAMTKEADQKGKSDEKGNRRPQPFRVEEEIVFRAGVNNNKEMVREWKRRKDIRRDIEKASTLATMMEKKLKLAQDKDNKNSLRTRRSPPSLDARTIVHDLGREIDAKCEPKGNGNYYNFVSFSYTNKRIVERKLKRLANNNKKRRQVPTTPLVTPQRDPDRLFRHTNSFKCRITREKYPNLSDKPVGIDEVEHLSVPKWRENIILV